MKSTYTLIAILFFIFVPFLSKAATPPTQPSPHRHKTLSKTPEASPTITKKAASKLTQKHSASHKTLHKKTSPPKQQATQTDSLDYKTILTYIKTKYKKIQQQDAEAISSYLVNYGKTNNVDPKLAAALIARESAFNKTAVSPTGAKGLGQIKDFNYKALNIKDPFNIKENVSGTTEYLQKMIGKWQNRFQKEAPEVAQNRAHNTLQKKQKKKQKKYVEDEEKKIKYALGSYFKGFTAMTREGMDAKTNRYVTDILKYYEDIKSTQRNVAKQKRTD